MAELKAVVKGIPAIFRANTVDAIIFGAVFYQRCVNPETPVAQILQSVAKHFGIADTSTLRSLETGYQRVQKAFLQNGGISE